MQFCQMMILYILLMPAQLPAQASQEVKLAADLWQSFDGVDKERRRQLSEDLAELILKLEKDGQYDFAVLNAKRIFEHSDSPKSRRICFAVIDRLDSDYANAIARPVVFEIPSVTCHGRLLNA